MNPLVRSAIASAIGGVIAFLVIEQLKKQGVIQ